MNVGTARRQIARLRIGVERRVPLLRLLINKSQCKFQTRVLRIPVDELFERGLRQFEFACLNQRADLGHFHRARAASTRR